MDGQINNLDFKTALNRIHYIKHAKRDPNYWHALFVNEIKQRVSKTNGNFNIIVQDPKVLSDFYSIPYSVVKPLLDEKYIDYSHGGAGRWVLTIRHGELCLNGTPLRIDITKFFQNFEGLNQNEFDKKQLEDSIDEYLASQSDEDNTDENYFEGGKNYAFRSYYERNPKLRKAAIKHHGTTCEVCGYNFERFYGEHGKNFIEVHHLKPINTLKNHTLINPITDMIVLCANCHRMIHKNQKNVLSIDQLRKLLKFSFLQG